jgi:hypothetical protein
MPTRLGTVTHATLRDSAFMSCRIVSCMTLPSSLAWHIEALRQRPIAATEKGFGPLAASHQVSAASLAAARPPLHEAGLSYPLLTLRESALAHNIEAMAA